MAKKIKQTPAEASQEGRETRLALWQAGRLKVDNAVTRRGVPPPSTVGIGDRSKPKYSWRPMSARVLTEAQGKDAKTVLDPDVMKGKVAANAEYVGTYHGHRGVIRPEYDLLEPFTIVDTEAYLKQAINRRLSLIMRNGYEIISEGLNQYSEYIQKRLNTMEYVTRRPTMNLFRDILTNLSLCSNCFLLKIRDEKGAGVPQKEGSKVPVAGYSIIPSHQIFPYIEKGVITKWRRYYDSGMPYEDYPLDDIVHLHFDRKNGHIFGTPRTIAVRDDIFALRRLEENIELLYINHLFPLFHVKVGTEAAPCTYYQDGSSEIELIRTIIETMPKEGIFTTDERVTVEVVGAQKESLNSEKVLAHLKGRVFAGLGMSPLDMGEGDSANRSTADNISQVLKDSIKADLDNFAGQIRLHIFAELFQESNVSLSVQAAVAATHLKFHEIDMDNRIKEENHATDLYNNNILSHEETRKRMKAKPMSKEQKKDTHHEREVKDLMNHDVKQQKDLAEHATEQQKSLATVQTKLMESEAELHKTKATAQTKVLHAKTKHAIASGEAAVKKATAGGKKVATKNRPTNQHGKNSDPHKAKSSLESIANLMFDSIMDAHDLWDKQDQDSWIILSSSAIDEITDELLSESEEGAENSYTRQVREGSSRLKDMIAVETDPEKIYILVSAEFNEDKEDVTEAQSDSTNGADEHLSEGSPERSISEHSDSLQPDTEGEDPVLDN